MTPKIGYLFLPLLLLSHFSLSHSVWPLRWQPTRFLCQQDSPGKNTGVGCHFLLHIGSNYLVNSGFLRFMIWRRQWHPTPVLLPAKSRGWRSLERCSPWDHWGLDTTEWLHFHFSLSCIGEGNGNPLQCPCLENPRDRGAWWAAVYGVAQSWTLLKWLSSSSSSICFSWYRFIWRNYQFSRMIQVQHQAPSSFQWIVTSSARVPLLHSRIPSLEKGSCHAQGSIH